ncbi:MAG TPA: hypothetical protein VFG69_01920 [Nannocystaceae bacterium]|nr:hypothetical protein [Nannocystaceae bacterium]
MRATNGNPEALSSFIAVEERLFAWDSDESTRRADAFVRSAMHLDPMPPRPANVLPFRVPEAPGSYAVFGGETVFVSSNDVALAFAVRLRAA